MKEVKTGYLSSPFLVPRVLGLSLVIAVGAFLWGESATLFVEIHRLRVEVGGHLEVRTATINNIHNFYLFLSILFLILHFLDLSLPKFRVPLR